MVSGCMRLDCSGVNSSAGIRTRNATSSSVSPSSVVLRHISNRNRSETATGRTQWEEPFLDPEGALNPVPTASPPPGQHHTKRRQYAAGQTQAYYGADTIAPPPGPAYGAVPGQPAQPSQLFTPGLAAEGQFAQQQIGQPGQPPYYGGAQPEPEYINQPGFGQGPVYQQPGVGALADQFSQMNVGQKGLRLFTTNLLTAPPEPLELHRPPPDIILPPNSCLSNSPFANADPSYQRCTLNAIPTSNSLLNKSKIPLGLVITPYRSLKEGDDPVPLITDTVIARCRRCRTYINPYVQFIDGGNR